MIAIVIHLIKNTDAQPNDPTPMFIFDAFSSYDPTNGKTRTIYRERKGEKDDARYG